MIIKVKNHQELNELVDTLALEIVDANINHRLYCDLLDAIEPNRKAFIQSRTYWYLTLTAIQDARMIHLCRFYDQESKSLSLYNLLETIKHFRNYFEKESFKLRLRDNPSVEELSRVHRLPNIDQLDKDLEFSSTKNQLVKRLMIWRNNIIAHKGAKNVLNKNEIIKKNPLSASEIQILLDTGFSILNRYSYLYKALSWSRKIIGHDDYNSLFKLLNLGLEKWDEDRKKELEEIKRRIAEPSA